MTRSIAVSTEAGTTARWWVSRTPATLQPVTKARPTATRPAPRGPATRQTRALDAATSFMVDAARAEGATWAEIGRALGISRQAVRQAATRRHDLDDSTDRSQDLAHAPAGPTPTTQVVPPPRFLLSAASLRGWGPAPPQRPPSSGAGSPKGLPERPHTHPAGSPRAIDVHATRAVDDAPGMTNRVPVMDEDRASAHRRALPDDGARTPAYSSSGILCVAGGWRGATVCLSPTAGVNSSLTALTQSVRVLERVSRFAL